MQRPGSALSKLKRQQQVLHITPQQQAPKKVYTKEEFIKNRDFEGAITVLEYEKQ